LALKKIPPWGSCERVNSDLVYNNGADGQSWKYADGTLICTKNVSWEGSCNVAWNPGYETPDIPLGNWPESFITAPAVSVSVYSPAGMVERISDVSTSSAGNIKLYRPSTLTATWTIGVMGIGRWK